MGVLVEGTIYMKPQCLPKEIRGFCKGSLQCCDSPKSRSKIPAAPTQLQAFKEESNSDLEASKAFNSFSLIFVACTLHTTATQVSKTNRYITND